MKSSSSIDEMEEKLNEIKASLTDEGDIFTIEYLLYYINDFKSMHPEYSKDTNKTK